MREINYTGNMTMADAPVIRKLGVVSKAGEMTPFVRHGRLMQVETISDGDPDTLVFSGSFIIRDLESGTCTKPVAPGWHFFSAYCEGARVYVFGTNEQPSRVWGGDTIRMYWSDDLVTWQHEDVIRREGWLYYNTSVCKGPDGYVMAIEAGQPREKVGTPFTTFFARSNDLHTWTLMPDEVCYSQDRYTACPALRYVAEDGYYYMVCLEALPKARYAPYIYRTKDFITWEIGLHNPILWISKEDRLIKAGVSFDAETTKRIHTYLNINNCDVDFCEYQGKTIISYLTGDQLGCGFMCEAVYDGPLNQFLQAFFR